MEKSAIEQEIRDFMSRTFLVEVGRDVKADTDLFEAGVIDSYGFIDLVAFIEKSFSVSLSDDDLTSPEMSTFTGISQLVTSRQAAGLGSAGGEGG